MQPSLIFATNNQHKAEEIQAFLNGKFEIISLRNAGIDVEIPEPYNTLEENADTKATTIFNLTQMDCFGEDTGLEVLSLNGEPGVKSARYAGESRNFKANIDKLLYKLKGKPEREARFRTVIALILGGKIYHFEGTCKGRILDAERGSGGFGYDPVFVPEGADLSFAEMTLEEKNKYSHRAKAVQKLIDFLLNK
ncbi:MAG: RdgB/HAM1 family non-canonical purine NTP pyrophosphatase [Bacteroidetes bacterium]|nr:RdgB/HAM1 family non-canonical purine NTP pyrophosphatase [Bacteroidota bacterium]